RFLSPSPASGGSSDRDRSIPSCRKRAAPKADCAACSRSEPSTKATGSLASGPTSHAATLPRWSLPRDKAPWAIHVRPRGQGSDGMVCRGGLALVCVAAVANVGVCADGELLHLTLSVVSARAPREGARAGVLVLLRAAERAGGGDVGGGSAGEKYRRVGVGCAGTYEAHHAREVRASASRGSYRARSGRSNLSRRRRHIATGRQGGDRGDVSQVSSHASA